MNQAIILVGMSGVGKSYHARILKKHSKYKVFSIDDMIARVLGKSDVHDVAKFLGPPYGEGYSKKSNQYLELEEQFTKEALDYADKHSDEVVVIDTTGSVVHLNASILKRIRASRYPVFLDTEPSRIEEMIQNYLKDPKPIIWGEMSKFFAKDTYAKELQDLYPKLLSQRRRIYGSISRYQIPFATHKKKSFNLLTYLGLLSKKRGGTR
jgi:shikimate kinase